jgi:hypothetical protein
MTPVDVVRMREIARRSFDSGSQRVIRFLRELVALDLCVLVMGRGGGRMYGGHDVHSPREDRRDHPMTFVNADLVSSTLCRQIGNQN